MEINRSDVQGIILRGFAVLRAARFWLLTVEEPAAARTFLADLVKEGAITSASRPGDDGKAERETCLNIAFPRQGLAKLGLPPETLGGFSREFLEGIDTEPRARILGDNGTSASSR